MICDYIPKFKIQRNEYIINKKKLKKFLGIGITAVAGWMIYTKTGFDKAVENFFLNLPYIGDLLQYDVVKVFLISIIIWYIKDILD